MKSQHYKWYALALLFLMYVINIIDRHIINILIEPIKAELALGDAEAGFITGLAFALFYTVMGVPIAILADRHHRARLICLCSALWSLATAATGAASSYASMAAARMAVGVGEAGLTPTANSLIGDLFEPRNRGKALGIYISAVSIGTMLAGLLGGWLEGQVGWRMTFVLLAIAGLALTAIFRVSFQEPPRGSLDDVSSAPERGTYTLMETVKHLLGKRSCRYFFPAFALVGFVGAAINNWTPAFFMRSHEMNLMQMAASVGAIFGAGGALGMIGGGLLADHFSTRDVSSYLKVPAIAVLVSLPLYFGVYVVSASTLALLLLAVPVTVGAIIVPPVLALIQRLAKNNMRAVAVAVFLVVVHLIGMGFGPLLVGMISDALHPIAGADSLRYALMTIIPLNLLAVLLFWRGARHVAADLGIDPSQTENLPARLGGERLAEK